MKDLIQLTSAKTSTKDVIVIRGRYFEAKSLKEYLRLCKKVKQLHYFLTLDGQLKITHDTGEVTFNQVGIDTIHDNVVTWFSHDLVLDGEFGGYKSAQKVKKGAAWEFCL